MSGGPACSCPESKKAVEDRRWCVQVYKANYSKFNGSRYTPSAYSLVECSACGKFWRTKAAYVDQLA